MTKIKIAIDGHSACGKSTLARALADILEYKYIDTGAMFRVLSMYFIDNKIDPYAINGNDLDLRNLEVEYKIGELGFLILMINGKDYSKQIRSMEVNNIVSEVSKNLEVRNLLKQIQQDLGKDGGVVLDGRDIGTVVFPDAELKIFLTASTEVRARRRLAELKDEATFQEVLENLEKRDKIDSTREIAPLKMADDAILIDNSDLTKDEQLKMVHKIAEERINLV